ncbi:hypothetical protein LAZ67_12003040 [Cordylochernes scorpioides]|uniref:Mos1 transposase HTH domain-containing protein n=1 Tax=Cordylochernes scorpioides TaxID=51811 RepID=A0ABY6L2Z0_9ARAC|nr:hypothetical protein LAZ67_12003040 [Cordylochernes scorpioides]
MATKGLILTLVQEAELLLKDAFKEASLGRPNPTANVPIPSTSFASVVAEKDKPVKPAPPKPKAKSTFVNLAPSFESHVVVRVDGEVRDDEICESFRFNHSVQSLLEKREIRVVHRSNNAAHSTSTVFIEVDNQVAEILGQHGRIPVAGLVHRSLARNHSRAAALDAWTEVYCQDHYNRHLRRIAHTPDRLLQFLPKRWSHGGFNHDATLLEGQATKSTYLSEYEDIRNEDKVRNRHGTCCRSPRWSHGGFNHDATLLEGQAKKSTYLSEYEDIRNEDKVRNRHGTCCRSPRWSHGRLNHDATLLEGQAKKSTYLSEYEDIRNEDKVRNRHGTCCRSPRWSHGGFNPDATLLEGQAKKSTYLSEYEDIRNEDKVFWIVFDFYLLKKMDQRTCIKFCVKNEIKCADAFRMLTVAYGKATLDRSNVYRWYKMFSEGREDVNDEEHAGRPSTSTTDEKINEVEKMILANRRITVREVAEDLNISIGSFHSIFINDLGMRRVAAKFVPKLLNCDQKQHRMNIANEMLDSVRDDPNLLQRVITGDEAWVYGYDVETKAQSSQWKLPHEPRPKKARQVRSNVKVLLTVFFDCRGMVHHEFLPQGRTVNKEYYLQVMRNLREAIRQKRPDLWKNKNWLLHHDNAPAHTSLLVRDFLAKNNTLMMPQPPYSPDLAPCDFFLFPKLKRPMKGRRYATLDEIKTASKEELKNIFLK